MREARSGKSWADDSVCSTGSNGAGVYRHQSLGGGRVRRRLLQPPGRRLCSGSREYSGGPEEPAGQASTPLLRVCLLLARPVRSHVLTGLLACFLRVARPPPLLPGVLELTLS